MTTLYDIQLARLWLKEMTKYDPKNLECIATCSEAIDILEGKLAARELTKQTRMKRTPFKETK